MSDWNLFEHMSKTYGLTLTGSEMHEIRVAAGLIEMERKISEILAIANPDDCQKFQKILEDGK